MRSQMVIPWDETCCFFFLVVELGRMARHLNHDEYEWNETVDGSFEIQRLHQLRER